ncbi:MAG TPA: ATP-binding protein [Gemmatimonadaceae bacterium]|nr:ATP-binding protein [Gemmatimonadaceae bacterium]
MTKPPNQHRRSLQTELLIKLAALLGVAVLLGLVLLSIPRRLLIVRDPVALTIVVTADILLFIGCAALLLQRAIVRPLRELVGAAEEIIAGNLTRRMPKTSVRELHQVASTFDRLTERVIEDQTQLVRTEKLASIGQLAAGVAQEIGDPLGAILGEVHRLRERLRERSESLDALSALERESTRIDRIVRGLLDYARSRPLAPAPVDVNEVVRSAASLLRSQGVFATVDVSLELTKLPLLVSGERHDIEQMFVNLLVNAVDAMNGRGTIVVRLERAARFTLRQPATRRGVDGSVEVVEHPPSSRVQRWLATHEAIEIAKIIVADSGPGVPSELAERIFDPFFTTKRAGKGAGLGLAIVSRIVDNLQGTVWVTTAREGGAAFHILFPVVPTPVAPGGGMWAARRGTSKRHSASRPPH